MVDTQYEWGEHVEDQSNEDRYAPEKNLLGSCRGGERRSGDTIEGAMRVYVHGRL